MFKDDDPFEGTRKEMDKAIRRLDALEWVILFFAVFMALGGGALVAWVLSVGTDLPFRLTWAVLSAVLLLVPGFVVFGRDALDRSRAGGSKQGNEGS